MLNDSYEKLQQKINELEIKILHHDITSRIETEHALNERIKELNGIFSLANLTNTTDNCDDIYNEFVHTIVPASMQFPEKTIALLTIQNKKYTNNNSFVVEKNKSILCADIIAFNEIIGELIVTYTDESPFIDIHEQKLIHEYGQMLSKRIERFKVQKELEKANSNLKKAQEIGNFGHWEYDLQNNFLCWSDQIFKIYELNPDIFIPTYQKVVNFFHPEDKDMVENAFKKSVDEKTDFFVEHRIITHSGNIKYITERAHIDYTSEGKPLKAIGSIADITDHKLKELELTKLSTAIKQSPVAIVITDLHGTIEYVNPSFTQITGYSLEEAIGNNPRFLKTDHYPESYYKNLWETISSGNIWTGEFYNKTKSGEYFWESAIISPIFHENKIVNYVGVKQNITEKKKYIEQIIQYSEQLQETNKTKDKFISILAHDLRNPFTSLLGFSELLLLELSENNTTNIMEYAQLIQQTAVNTFATLNDLLLWGKSQQNQITYDPKKVSIATIIHESIPSVLMLSDAKKIVLNIQMEHNYYVLADKEMIKTVIRNLLTNAVKFTHEAGTITIGLSEINDFIEVSITDTGIGMNETTMKNLFIIGNNTSTNGTNDEVGTGLGLLLCKDFIEKHQGTICVESKSGKGSSFRFTLKKA